MKKASGKIIDAYPDKAQYYPGDEVLIRVDYQFHPPGKRETARLRAAVYKGLALAETIVEPIKSAAGIQSVAIHIHPDAPKWQGYGVDVELYQDEQRISRISTAFDVVADWHDTIRYGFVCDFYRENEGDTAGISQLRKYHINAVQFYDWMYRHERLVPETRYFTDMLGRELSVKAIRDKIGACHQYDMKAMAYGAVYACSREFYETHKEWGMYQNDGKIVSLDDWLYLMDISPDSPWTSHICGEFIRAMRAMDFDGIHLDTYGFPKKAYIYRQGEKELMDLSEALPAFIDRMHGTVEPEFRGAGVTYNNVSNWPTFSVARSQVDAIYIEIWDPADRYYDLYRTITDARALSDKPINLAAYCKPFAQDVPFAQQETSLLLTSAVIFASGGFHLVLGENNGILNDPYFVKYSRLEQGQTARIRAYFDFIVRYGDLLLDPRARDLSMTHANGINGEFTFSGCPISAYGESGKVWTLVKETGEYYIIHLINLCGIQNQIWHQPKQSPATVNGIGIDALVEERVRAAYIASPDIDGGCPCPLDVEEIEGSRGLVARMVVDTLHIWDVIFLEKKDR